MGQVTIKGGDYNRQNLLKKDKDYLVDQCLGLKKRIEILEQRINKRPTDVKDRNGRMIHFGDTVRFIDKVEWYRGVYWPKVATGVMTRTQALDEIDKKPYEERLVEDVQDYDWLLSSEIQTYWEVVD